MPTTPAQEATERVTSKPGNKEPEPEHKRDAEVPPSRPLPESPAAREARKEHESRDAYLACWETWRDAQLCDSQIMPKSTLDPETPEFAPSPTPRTSMPESSFRDDRFGWSERETPFEVEGLLGDGGHSRYED